MNNNSGETSNDERKGRGLLIYVYSYIKPILMHDPGIKTPTVLHAACAREPQRNYRSLVCDKLFRRHITNKRSYKN